MALALYVFMADTLRVADGGVDAVRNVLPAKFNWPLFCAALGLMAAPVIQLGRQVCLFRRAGRSLLEPAADFACKQSPQN
jgi:hypothetical protein